jgi:hypothetical protein
LLMISTIYPTSYTSHAANRQTFFPMLRTDKFAFFPVTVNSSAKIIAPQ